MGHRTNSRFATVIEAEILKIQEDAVPEKTPPGVTTEHRSMKKQDASRHLTKRGKLDMRTKENRQELGGCNVDGSPDKRLRVNKRPPKSLSNGESIGSLKGDGTPDVSSQRSSGSSGDSSGSSSYALVGYPVSPVRSAFESENEAGTFKCEQPFCNICPYICNLVKISGPKRSVQINDHFTCISEDVIYSIICRLCEKIYIGETGRELGVRFHEHLRDVKKGGSSGVARHFNLRNHSDLDMRICGVSLDHENKEHRQYLQKKFIRELGTLIPLGINLICA